jgi:hypothetical protein
MIKPEQLTADWFSARLSVTVEHVELDTIVWGTGTKVLMRLSYAQDTGLPSAVCVKGGFDERIQDYGWMESAFATEANFFARLAPELRAAVPRCLYAGDGIVVLEDLRAGGATFGDPLEPWSADRVARALEAQAAWHRPTWGIDHGALGELPVGSGPVRAATETLLSEAHWNTMFSSGQAAPIPNELDARERILSGFRELWKRDEVGPVALSHGDAHIGNTYIDAHGRPGFLDWQGTCRAPAMYDAAYFLGGAMEPDARRAAERDLIEHYVQALSAGDGPRIDPDDAWRDYIRYTLHGFLWVVTPAVMQPQEKVHAMGARHATAIADHDTLSALGV